MAGRGRPRWRGTVLMGLLGLAIAVAVIAVTWSVKGYQAAVNVAGLVGVALAIPPAVAGLLRLRRPTAAPTTKEITDAKDRLAGVLAEQWRTEATLRSLADPGPMPVQWHLTERAAVMDRQADAAPDRPALAGSSAQVDLLATRIRELPRQRLVILGEPGTGKTTLAVQLLQELLATRQEDEPVPVLLSVAGWDTRTFRRLHDWLAVRLGQDYHPALRAPGLGPDLPRRLAARGHILPVLDGLDELPDDARAAVIKALNQSLDHDDQLILTCRTDEFDAAVRSAGEVLRTAAVIEPRPLGSAVAAGYLRTCLSPEAEPRWEEILDGMHGPGERSGPAAALTETVSTPLGLWLVRATYIATGTDPAPLLSHPFSTTRALRSHLFDQLIPALIDTRKPPRNDDTAPASPLLPRREHEPAEVRDRLGYLAHHLTCQPARTGGDGHRGARDFAWWRLAAGTNAITATTVFIIVLLIVLAYGLLFGLADGPAAGLAGGLSWGLIFGAVVGSQARRWAAEAPGYADLQIRERWAELLGALAPSLSVALALGLLGSLAYGLAGGLILGFTLGLMMLALAFSTWTWVPDEPHHPLTPMESWRADRRMHLVRLTTTMLTGVGMAGVPSWFYDELPLGIAFGLLSGFLCGSGKMDRAWLAYLVATWRLARAGLLPRRLMPFLDDMHRLGLLRAVGPIYQFRHAELQDHLAATYRSHRQGHPR